MQRSRGPQSLKTFGESGMLVPHVAAALREDRPAWKLGNVELACGSSTWAEPNE
jgi:hypothetical protein